MANGAFVVLDGVHLRQLVQSNFDAAVTGAQLLARADSLVSNYLYTLPLPGAIKSSALRRIGVQDEDVFLSSELDRDQASQTLNLYVTAIADLLKEDPIVVAVLDGKTIREVLEDEDDLAMIAENIFIELDVKDKGKIDKSEISNALVLMGVEMGVPLVTDFPLLESILTKHVAYQQEELGQAQFAVLLQSVLQELAHALANTPIVLMQGLVVINGSRLRKVLADEKELSDIVEKIQVENQRDKDNSGILPLLRNFLEKKGLDLGLPPASEANEHMYDLAFAEEDVVEIFPESDELAILRIVKRILKSFAELLEASPVYHNVDP